MRYYFTADYHLDHENIIKYCDRPFDDVEEMNFIIMENHNKIVEPEDIVFFLGDFSFGNRNKFLGKFNGKFIFIRGNHDKKPVIDSLQINYGGMDINLIHWPRDVDPNFDLNLVGHVHEKWRTQKLSSTILINIGVDQWDFKPVSIGNIHRVINEDNLRQKSTAGYQFFQNKSCPFFPYSGNNQACHPDSDPRTHNCLLCFCPLYLLNCPREANPKILDNGVKDCSECLYPHKLENYKEIMGYLEEEDWIVSKNMDREEQ